MQSRNERKGWLIKGFYQDKDTYLGSIIKLMWARNEERMHHMHDKNHNCMLALDRNGGKCLCEKHTWLRGNNFNPDNKFVSGWEDSICNSHMGYFTEDCSKVKAEGANRFTACPMDKFLTGVHRNGGGGLDHLEFECCKAEYHEPLTGEKPLPEQYLDHQGKVTFKLDNGHFLHSDGKDVVLYSN